MTRPRPIPPDRNRPDKTSRAGTDASNGIGNGHGPGKPSPVSPSVVRASRMAMARRPLGDEAEPQASQDHDANLDYGDRPPTSIGLIDPDPLDGTDEAAEEPGCDDAIDLDRIDDEVIDLDRLDRLDDLDRLDRLDLASAPHESAAGDAGDRRHRSEVRSASGRSRGSRSAIAAQRRRVFAALFFAWMMIVVGVIAGFLFAEAQPDRWAAEAEIVLEPRSSQIDRFLATEVVWIASSTVIDRAAATVGVDRKYISENLNVSTIDASTAVGVQFVDEDPELAIQVVTAVVDSYLANVRNQPVSTTRSVYSARIDELRSARAAIEVELAAVERSNATAEGAGQALPFPTEQRRLALESQEILGQISGLEQQLIVTDIEILNQAQATVVTPSHLLEERVAPTPITFAALGAMVGGALAAATIFLVGRRRSLASGAADG